MKKLLIILAGLSSLAFAQDGTTAADWSVAIQAGIANNGDIYRDNNTSVGGGFNAQPAAAFRFDASFLLNQYMALEAGYAGTTSFTGSNGAKNGSLEFKDVSFVGILPLGDYFSLHGQIGGAYVTGTAGTYDATNTAGSNGSAANINLMMGVGAQFNATKNISIILNDYMYAGVNGNSTGELGDTNLLMGGVRYRF